eukprot:13556374-Alexandrium_andersonii.AAC.1
MGDHMVGHLNYPRFALNVSWYSINQSGFQKEQGSGVSDARNALRVRPRSDLQAADLRRAHQYLLAT